MRMLRRIFAHGRIRSARKRLDEDSSPRNYVALAQEYLRFGMTEDALAVCDEGLGSFSGNALLLRLRGRAARMGRELKLADLKRSLAHGPAVHLYAQMCQTLLEMERPDRAEESAAEWIAWQDGGEARLMMARARVERFFADRGRDLGVAAIGAVHEAVDGFAGDPRPLRLELELLSRIGAWADARRTVQRLLELEPGDPDLEGRFRALADLEADAPSVDRALLEVERTGRFAEDGSSPSAKPLGQGKVRPLLRELARGDDVHAAVYMRGATVLIQGPRGATAERTARSLRSILSSGRSTARRLGLGRILQVQLEGDFGQLSLAPGESDAGAVWSKGALGRERDELLLGLAGLNADLEEVAS